MSVHRGSYYDWKRQAIKPLPTTEALLRQRMTELFKVSRQSMGSRRMVARLREEGHIIGRYRVRKLMKTLGLKVRTKKKYRITTNSKHQYPVAENILNRNFSPDTPNKAWGTDITYIWTQEGWLYLAIVIDLYSRRIVGWSIDKQMTTSLVKRALMMAFNLRQPEKGLVHHSDRGSQYASHEYQGLLRQYQMQPSMSRKGNCWDNSPVERFFSSLKREWIGDQLYHSRSKAIADIREYLMVYYNSVRLHSTLGYKTPMEFEKIA